MKKLAVKGGGVWKKLAVKGGGVWKKLAVGGERWCGIQHVEGWR